MHIQRRSFIDIKKKLLFENKLTYKLTLNKKLKNSIINFHQLVENHYNFF